MEYTYNRRGNAIAKTAKIHGAQFIVHQGVSVVESLAEIHGELNNGRPIISWGKHVVIGSRAVLQPARKPTGEYTPLRIGNYVSIGSDTVIMASSIGSRVIVGKNCQIGAHAVIRDCTIIPDGSVVPPSAVVAPYTLFHAPQRYAKVVELPESAEEAIQFFCEMKFQGIEAPVPFIKAL